MLTGLAYLSSNEPIQLAAKDHLLMHFRTEPPTELSPAGLNMSQPQKHRSPSASLQKKPRTDY
jgi:hypothetical protein